MRLAYRAVFLASPRFAAQCCRGGHFSRNSLPENNGFQLAGYVPTGWYTLFRQSSDDDQKHHRPLALLDPSRVPLVALNGRNRFVNSPLQGDAW